MMFMKTPIFRSGNLLVPTVLLLVYYLTFTAGSCQDCPGDQRSLLPEDTPLAYSQMKEPSFEIKNDSIAETIDFDVVNKEYMFLDVNSFENDWFFDECGNDWWVEAYHVQLESADGKYSIDHYLMAPYFDGTHQWSWILDLLP